MSALFVTDPLDDIALIKVARDQLMEGTGSWVMRDPNFTAWLNDNRSSILWIHGDPGKGKTMLTISLIEELSRKITAEGTAASTTCLAYILCDGTDSRRSNTISIVRTILWQLLCQRPRLLGCFKDEYSKKKEHLFTSPNALQALWRILQKVLDDSSIQKVYLIVDGLDECEMMSLQPFLTMLEPYLEQHKGNLGHASCIAKWLVVSRNYPEVRETLSTASEIDLESDTNTSQISRAVNDFINLKVDFLTSRKRYQPTVKSMVKASLQEKAAGTFLWVALACRELKAAPAVGAEETLSTLPSGLVPFYHRMLSRVTNNPLQHVTQSVIEILRAASVAFRPLTVNDMAVAACIPGVEDLKEYISLCASFLSIRDHTVFFVHQSAKEFLCSPEVPFISSNLASEHCTMATRCLKFLCSQVETEESGTEESETLNGYSEMYWLKHAMAVHPDFTSMSGLELQIYENFDWILQRWLPKYWPWAHPKHERAPFSYVGPRAFTKMHFAGYSGLLGISRRLILAAGRSLEQLNQQDSLGNTPLHWAARGGHADLVRLLLDSGVDVTIKNDDAESALHTAAANGNQEVTEALLEKVPSEELSSQNSLGRSPLHLAAANGSAGVLGQLLKRGASISLKDTFGYTAVHSACLSGGEESVAALLEFKPDIMATTNWRATALHIAAETGESAVTRLLVKNGANVEAEDYDGASVLHYAAGSGSLEVIRLLRHYGAQLGKRNSNGQTALHYAAEYGHESTVEWLIQEGADVTTADKRLQTALHIASRRGYDKVVSHILMGTDLPDHRGRTPLHDAASEGHSRVMSLLVPTSRNLNSRDKTGRTALWEAAVHGYSNIVELLLEHNADPNLSNNDTIFPIHVAVRNGHATTLRQLVSHGANCHIRDYKGRTPLDLALEKGDSEAIKLLRQLEADATYD
jgi:ankyrin repeat protein